MNNMAEQVTLQRYVAGIWGINEEDIFKKTKKREVVEARQVCMAITLRETDASLQRVGTYFGGKTHATALHARRVANNFYETDKEFRRRFDDVLNAYIRGIIKLPFTICSQRPPAEHHFDYLNEDAALYSGLVIN